MALIHLHASAQRLSPVIRGTGSWETCSRDSLRSSVVCLPLGKSSHDFLPRSLDPRPITHFHNPVNIVQYHKRHQRGHSPIELDCGFPPMVSQLRTWQDGNFGSLDFEVGLQEDAMSNTILSSISGGRSVGGPGLWGKGRGNGRKLILKQSLGRCMRMDLSFRWGRLRPGRGGARGPILPLGQ